MDRGNENIHHPLRPRSLTREVWWKQSAFDGYRQCERHGYARRVFPVGYLPMAKVLETHHEDIQLSFLRRGIRAALCTGQPLCSSQIRPLIDDGLTSNRKLGFTKNHSLFGPQYGLSLTGFWVVSLFLTIRLFSWTRFSTSGYVFMTSHE